MQPLFKIVCDVINQFHLFIVLTIYLIFFADTGITGLRNEDELVEFLMFANKTMNNTNDYLAGVVFTNHFKFSDTREKVEYKLRFSSYPRNSDDGKSHLNVFKDDTRWYTGLTFPLFQKVGPRKPGTNCNGMPGTFCFL